MKRLNVLDRSKGIILLVILLLLLPFIGLVSRLELSGDFLGYWAGSRLVLRGENAYDVETIHQLQRSTGRGESYAVRVWNPPWTNVILLPFGILPFAWARASWLVVSILLLGISGYWLGHLYWVERGKISNLMAVILPLFLLIRGMLSFKGRLICWFCSAWLEPCSSFLSIQCLVVGC